ncbi:MAG: energy transducer TonB, partial [Blastocatellia bacterium]
TWLMVAEESRLEEIAPGDTSVIGIIVPAEVFDQGAKRLLQKLRLVVTGAVPQPKDHEVVLTLVPQTGRTNNRADEMPAVLKSVGATYTDEALRDRIKGVVRIKALIESDGVVRRAMVIRHLPDGLDEQALAAVYGTKFKPALKDGHPVQFWQVIEVTFKL